MRFYEFQTIRDQVCKIDRSVRQVPLKEAYGAILADLICALHERGERQTAEEILRGTRSHYAWEKCRRPYHLVYPGIVPLLCRISLDLDGGLVPPFPYESILLRFPVGPENPFPGRDLDLTPWCVQSALVYKADDLRVEGKTVSGLYVEMDCGETEPAPPGSGLPDATISTYRVIPLIAGRQIEEVMNSLPVSPNAVRGRVIPKKVVENICRLVISLSLLQDDPTIIEPDVLSADAAKYAATGDPTLISRAHNRGKFGWIIGRKLEVLPHYRRPHFCLFWTGQGRRIPRIGPRKGSVIHRSVVEKLPTAFTEESTEENHADHKTD